MQLESHDQAKKSMCFDFIKLSPLMRHSYRARKTGEERVVYFGARSRTLFDRVVLASRLKPVVFLTAGRPYAECDT